MDVQGVQEKLCFFTIHCNPSLAYIAIRDLQSSLNAMRVYSHSYWLVIFAQPIAADCWRGGGGKLLRIHGEKNTIINEHPVYLSSLSEAQSLLNSNRPIHSNYLDSLIKSKVPTTTEPAALVVQSD